MAVLTALSLLLADADGERLRIRLKDPAWSEATLSIDARVLMRAEIQPGDLLKDAWMEFRRGPGEDWQRRSIAPGRFLRLSAERTAVFPLLEPGSLPGVRSGDTLEVRIAAVGRGGASERSSPLKLHLQLPEERELLLLRGLEENHRESQNLRRDIELDHRRLSRIERRSRDAEALEPVALEDLRAMADRWTSIVRDYEGLGNALREMIDQAETDRLVDSRPADRMRRSVEIFRDRGDGSPVAAIRQAFARALKAPTPAERRTALQSVLDDTDRFLDLLKRPEGDLQVWHESHVVRRALRSLLQGQKTILEELDRKRDR
jgi:hypothetical protein